MFTKNKFAKIDTRRFPIIVLEPFNQAPTITQIDAFFAELEEVLKKHEGPYVAIRHFPSFFLSPAKMRYIIKRSNELRAKAPGRILGSVVVIPSPMARKMFQLADSLVMHYSPRLIAGSREEAYVAAQGLLHKAGLSVLAPAV